MEKNFEICKVLSGEIRKNELPTNIDGWQIICEESHSGVEKASVYKKIHFVCAAFKKNDETIIVYRGTDDIIDVITDMHFLAKKIPPSARIAAKFYSKIKEKFPKNKIWLTGHSLGGAYAQITAARAIRDGEMCNAITFNAPGLGYALSKKEREKHKAKLQKNISNYVIMNDFVGNFREHAGSTYYMQPYPLNIPNPEKANANITPHNAILGCCEEINGKIICCPENWNCKCAWALWIYDKNPVSSKEKGIRRLLDAKTSYNHLKKGMDIIEKLKVEDKFVLLNSFYFRCRRKDFALPAN